MVFGCLFLSLASVLYCFSNSLYRLLYLTGFLFIARYAEQKFDSINQAFFTQTTLILIIGLGLYFAESRYQKKYIKTFKTSSPLPALSYHQII